MAQINLDEKKARFKRLASYRVNEILKRLRVLGNCANRGVYDYNREDIDKIFNVVNQKVKETKSKFHFPKEKEFRL